MLLRSVPGLRSVTARPRVEPGQADRRRKLSTEGIELMKTCESRAAFGGGEGGTWPPLTLRPLLAGRAAARVRARRAAAGPAAPGPAAHRTAPGVRRPKRPADARPKPRRRARCPPTCACCASGPPSRLETAFTCLSFPKVRKSFSFSKKLCRSVQISLLPSAAELGPRQDVQFGVETVSFQCNLYCKL